MTKPEAVGLSSERLARLDRAMTEKYVDSGQLPGFLVQIFRRGELAHASQAGFMDIAASASDAARSTKRGAMSAPPEPHPTWRTCRPRPGGLEGKRGLAVL